MNDKQFLLLLKQADEPFTGRDFSFITETGRMKSELLSWSYGSIATSLIQRAKSMLDYGFNIDSYLNFELLKDLLISIVIFPLCGIICGWSMWKLLERKHMS